MEKEMLGIVFAVCCLLLTAVNDFVFKLFARKERSKGMFCFLIGIFWMFALAWSLDLHNDSINWKSSIFWGSVSGIFSAGGNLLLIEGMSRQSAGICSLIYRLNMILVVIGAGLFLGEVPIPVQYVGIFCALAAVVLFQYGSSSGDEKRNWLSPAILIVAVAAVMRAGMGLSYKYGFSHGADKNLVPFINSIFWIVGGLIYALVKERKMLKLDRELTVYGSISGVTVAAIVFFMAGSLYYGKAAVVLPIAQMSFIGTFVLGIVFLKERFSRAHIPALLCGIIAVILLSL